MACFALAGGFASTVTENRKREAARRRISHHCNSVGKGRGPTVDSNVKELRKIYRGLFSQGFTSTDTKIRLICAATAKHRSCTDGHPTHAGPMAAVTCMPLLAGPVLRWRST